MKYSNLFIVALMSCTFSCTQTPPAGPPSASISNEHVNMKLYLPDADNGFYRATRFDWSGIIYSLEYAGHQYVGEWKKTQDPLFHEDLTGPAEGYIDPGLGFDEAEIGGEFVRIGVGALKKTEAEYDWMKTYEIIDHGKWELDQGKDWITFKQTLQRETGWAYVYTKSIELMKDEAGFAIIHSLKNTGSKAIQTDQFNHNFFVMDGEMTGPDFEVEFPFLLSTESELRDLVKLEGNKILFTEDLSRGSVYMILDGHENSVEDHQMQIVNRKTGAGVKLSVDQPLSKMVFWATTTTLCPENFLDIDVAPGEEKTWTSRYSLFTTTK